MASVFLQKDVAEAIWYARQGKKWAIHKLNGLDKDGKPDRYRQQNKKWIPLYESDLLISSFCCIKQKEEPIANYEKQTGRHPLLAIMAVESARRREAYLRTGCNSFSGRRPVSKPMSFWTNQDVLQYIVERDIKIASSNGMIVEEGCLPGQMNLMSSGRKLFCTGEPRTGCMFCPVGCHLDGLQKFERLKKYNRKLYDYCMDELGEWKLLEWVSRNCLKVTG